VVSPRRSATPRFEPPPSEAYKTMPAATVNPKSPPPPPSLLSLSLDLLPDLETLDRAMIGAVGMGVPDHR
jgi:hypothetical protein